MSSATPLRRVMTVFAAVLLTIAALVPCAFRTDVGLATHGHATLKAAALSSPAAFAAERSRQNPFGLVAAIGEEFAGSGSADSGRSSLVAVRDQRRPSVLRSGRNGTRAPPFASFLVS